LPDSFVKEGLVSVPPPEASIAVLPFLNISPDPENEYISDGITEEIINSITKVPGLKVIARTSTFALKNTTLDVPEIGNLLGVANVLEGSVRKAGNRLRIAAKLIQCHDRVQLWTKTFDREMEDIFALQDEISLLIADQIRENFGHLHIADHLSNIPTKNVAAYNLYLKARYNHLKWDRTGISNAIALYKEAIALDPGFSLPYFGIGFSLAMRAAWSSDREKAREADSYLKEGFKLDNDSFLGHFGKATLYFWAQWNFKKGHQHYLRAMELNPSFTEAEEGLAELYRALGETELGLQHADNILRLNPLSANHYYTKGVMHYLQQEYATTLECMEAGLRIDNNFGFCRELAIICLIHLQRLDDLKAFLKKYPDAQKPQEALLLYKLLHEEEQITIDLSQVDLKLQQLEGPTLLAWGLYLQVHLGHHDMALDTLEKGIASHTGQFMNFKRLPLLEPLRKYPRYKKLVEKVFRPEVMPDLQKNTLPSEEKESSKPIFSPEEAAEIVATLKGILEKEKLYLDPSLSLKSLAEHMAIHPNRLSFLINSQIGQNFNEFINHYRLATFKEKALDPNNSHITLLGLAYESGFNSKTVFNSFFKKVEQMTPKKWVAGKDGGRGKGYKE
jgi:adenylate cyclase